MALREDDALSGLMLDASVRRLMGRNGVRPGEMARALVIARTALRGENGRRNGGHCYAIRAWPPTLDRVSGLLVQAANMLDDARTAAALRSAVAFNLGLWRGIARMMASDGAASLNDEQRRLLHGHAVYVIQHSTPRTCPDDIHIETFITLARRDSEWLAEAVVPDADAFSVA
ncbi:MAG: hypothetical protein WCZ23_12225 [Rhodospirillaceae bacterium]